MENIKYKVLISRGKPGGEKDVEVGCIHVFIQQT